MLNDNPEPDLLAFIHEPADGLISMTLPIKRGTELAPKITYVITAYRTAPD